MILKIFLFMHRAFVNCKHQSMNASFPYRKLLLIQEPTQNWEKLDFNEIQIKVFVCISKLLFILCLISQNEIQKVLQFQLMQHLEINFVYLDLARKIWSSFSLPAARV